MPEKGKHEKPLLQCDQCLQVEGSIDAMDNHRIKFDIERMIHRVIGHKLIGRPHFCLCDNCHGYKMAEILDAIKEIGKKL